MKNGMIMAAAALIMRAAGMGMRVWLSGRLGAEGMGVYQLTLSAYAFFALVCSSGVTVTVTRLVCELTERRSAPAAAYAAEKVMTASFVVSSLLAMCMFFSADYIGIFLGSEQTVPAIRILSPSLPLMSVSAAARGYFTARRRIIAPTVEQMIEQATEIAVCAAAFAMLPTHSTRRACAYAAAGTTASEAVSFVYILIVYAIDVRSFAKGRSREDGLVRRALPIYLPCTASSALRSLLAAVENMLIPAGLVRGGTDSKTALARYGMISGMAMPVIVFPSFVILPFATLMITEMSSAKAGGRTLAVQRMAQRVVGVTLKYSVPVAMIMIFFSRQLSEALYGNSEVGLYIAALAPVVPLMYLDSAVDGMLEGLGEQTSYFVFNAVDSALRVVLMLLLVPVFGTWAVISVIILSELFNTALSVWKLIKVSKMQARPVSDMLLPCLCAAVPCMLFRFTGAAGKTSIIVTVLCCSAIYLFLLAIIKINSKKLLLK